MGHARPLFFLALYSDAVVAFEVPQLAFQVCSLHWSIRVQGFARAVGAGSGLRTQSSTLPPSMTAEVETRKSTENGE